MTPKCDVILQLKEKNAVLFAALVVSVTGNVVLGACLFVHFVRRWFS